MYLHASCPKCGANYQLGHLSMLPQPFRLMTQMADIYHGHRCASVAKLDGERQAV
jgi:hypothetical protein